MDFCPFQAKKVKEYFKNFFLLLPKPIILKPSNFKKEKTKTNGNSKT